MTPESPSSTKKPKWSANPKADLIQMLERDCVDRCPSVTSGDPREFKLFMNKNSAAEAAQFFFAWIL